MNNIQTDLLPRITCFYMDTAASVAWFGLQLPTMGFGW